MPTISRTLSLKARAIQWLSQREHSRQEMRDKLLRALRRAQALAAISSAQSQAAPQGAPLDSTREHDPQSGVEPLAEVELVLQWLEDHGYLSQARFVESRVHARQPRFGNLRIRQELQQHGLSLDAPTQLALKQSELARAQALWLKRYGQAAQEPSERLRQMRFLAGRGFSPDVVRQVVKGNVDPDVD